MRDTKYTTIFQQYICKPFRIVLTTLSTLLIVSLIYGLDQASDHFSRLAVAYTPEWLYSTLLHIVTTTLASVRGLTFLVLIYLAKSILIYAVTVDFVRIYRGKIQSLVATMAALRGSSFVWFLAIESCIFALFAVLGTLFYTVGYCLWASARWNTTWYLLALFALLYPAFYASVSMAAFVAALPMDTGRKTGKLIYLMNWQACKKLYLFFSFRASIEIILGIIAPIISFYMISNKLLSTIIATFCVVIPFATLKGSSLEFKLHLYSADGDIRNLFPKHYTPELSSVENSIAT
jgi:hypothetical protein